MLHPSVKIASVLALALMVNLAGVYALAIVAVPLAVLLLHYRVMGFWKMLRRVRWILLTLLLVYAFSTPGEYLAQWPAEWLAPTYEGLRAGLMQLARLCVMLAGLSLLLATTSRSHLIAGFYLLLRPLRHLGLQPQRFAARLWLTLHYVEQRPSQQAGQGNLFERLAAGFAATDEQAPQSIEFSLPAFGWRDMGLLAAFVAIGVFLL